MNYNKFTFYFKKKVTAILNKSRSSIVNQYFKRIKLVSNTIVFLQNQMQQYHPQLPVVSSGNNLQCIQSVNTFYVVLYIYFLKKQSGINWLKEKKKRRFLFLTASSKGWETTKENLTQPCFFFFISDNKIQTKTKRWRSSTEFFTWFPIPDVGMIMMQAGMVKGGLAPSYQTFTEGRACSAPLTVCRTFVCCAPLLAPRMCCLVRGCVLWCMIEIFGHFFIIFSFVLLLLLKKSNEILKFKPELKRTGSSICQLWMKAWGVVVRWDFF